MAVKTELTRDDILDLLRNVIGSPKVIDKASSDNIQFCCFHGERRPSAGVSVNKQSFNCFSCHAHGSIPWLLTQALPDDFRNLSEANEFLYDRYGVDYRAFNKIVESGIIRYEDLEDDLGVEDVKVNPELPIYYMAQYRCGKETFKYFFNRGFTEESMNNFRVGRDIVSKTVVVPINNIDGALIGFIGRYISKDRKHNERYKIYEGLKTASVLFPIDKFKIGEDNSVILVEGLLDALWMHQLGFTNTLATLTNFLSDEQADILYDLGVDKVYDFYDNDSAGIKGSKSIRLNMRDVKVVQLRPYYPNGAKDPQECLKSEIVNMLHKANKPVSIKRRDD